MVGWVIYCKPRNASSFVMNDMWWFDSVQLLNSHPVTHSTEKGWKAKDRYRAVGPRETSRTMEHKLEGHFFQRRDTQVHAVKQAAPFVVAELIPF